MRLLINENEESIADEDGWGWNTLQLYTGPTSTYSWLLKKSVNEFQYEDSSEPLWVSKFAILPNVLDLIRESLPNRQITSDVVMQRDRDGYTILHHALQFWSIASAYELTSKQDFPGLENWESFV